MNILMTSEFFYPHVGGLESITESLADEFVRMGHSVIIITSTVEKGDKTFSYIVLRKPSIKAIWEAYKWCDVFVHQQISLKRIWPLFLRKKPWYVVFHQVGWPNGIKGMIKSFVTKFSNNICVSKTTAEGYKLRRYSLIYNAYNDDIFKLANHCKRKDIAFVGRLTKSKGVYLLIEAFNEFKKETGSDYMLKLIGDSSERQRMEEFAAHTEYASDIVFLGTKTPHEISKILNDCDILAVTSTHPYYEAFGIVVLEGLACGCTVIGADGDGIEEALHSAGILYKNGDCHDLCNALIAAYNLPQDAKVRNMKIAAKWLKSRTKQRVAEEYIHAFKRYVYSPQNK